jgi:hypothetical protein
MIRIEVDSFNPTDTIVKLYNAGVPVKYDPLCGITVTSGKLFQFMSQFDPGAPLEMIWYSDEELAQLNREKEARNVQRSELSAQQSTAAEV